MAEPLGIFLGQPREANHLSDKEPDTLAAFSFLFFYIFISIGSFRGLVNRRNRPVGGTWCLSWGYVSAARTKGSGVRWASKWFGPSVVSPASNRRGNRIRTMEWRSGSTPSVKSSMMLWAVVFKINACTKVS